MVTAARCMNYVQTSVRRSAEHVPRSYGFLYRPLTTHLRIFSNVAAARGLCQQDSHPDSNYYLQDKHLMSDTDDAGFLSN